LWIYSVPDKKMTPVIQIPGSAQNNANLSPDGRWLAYHSNETGRFEVYVQPFPGTGGKFQITRDGGQHPLWSPDGKELFYESTGRLFSVSVRTQGSFEFSNPTQLPIPAYAQGQGTNPRAYDITADGKRFIMAFRSGQANGGSSPALQIQVVLNWFEELKQRTGGK
jgi:hypothetical protein